MIGVDSSFTVHSPTSPLFLQTSEGTFTLKCAKNPAKLPPASRRYHVMHRDYMKCKDNLLSTTGSVCDCLKSIFSHWNCAETLKKITLKKHLCFAAVCSYFCHTLTIQGRCCSAAPSWTLTSAPDSVASKIKKKTSSKIFLIIVNFKHSEKNNFNKGFRQKTE